MELYPSLGLNMSKVRLAKAFTPEEERVRATSLHTRESA
ncbi:hypothetical protein NIES2098_12740 [Calothrix sp. NIES-2098]|nr:hypothetical protein NIES2098_12740 [Calothrix sp. NIES-2098]